MSQDINSYRVVNNSCCDISMFDHIFLQASDTGILPEELADLFVVRLLKGFNADGTNRLIVEAA